MYDLRKRYQVSAEVRFRIIPAVALGAVLLGLAGQAAQAAVGDIPPAARVAPDQAWFDTLTEPGEPIVYRGEQLDKLTFPLGGIGTGSIWLNGEGRLVHWQIFNNINRYTEVDDTFFAVRIEQPGKPPIVRVLQRPAIGAIKGIDDLTFAGRYPVATLTYRDPGLPVDLEVEAFNPLIPDDPKNSALPCAIFHVRAINKTEEPVRVSVLASVQNAVNHANHGNAEGIFHLTYGGNVNRPVDGAGFKGVAMSAVAGRIARMDPPIELMTDEDSLQVIDESPVAGCHLIGPGAPFKSDSSRRVYWITRGDLNQLGGSTLKEMADAVRERGALLLINEDVTLGQAKVEPTLADGVERKETVLGAFDDGDYDGWRRASKSFMHPRPKSGAIGQQGRVTGFFGAGLANSYYQWGHKRGSLHSPKFKLEDRYVSFLLGGGNEPGLCAVNLHTGQEALKSATGQNSNHLERVEWDVAEFKGRKVYIEVLDDGREDWSYVLADDIRLSNVPLAAITVSEARAWNELLAGLEGTELGASVQVGRGQVARLPRDLTARLADKHPVRARDGMLAMIASLAGVGYEPAMSRPTDAPSFGTMVLAATDPSASAQVAWTEREEMLDAWMRGGQLSQGAAKATEPSPAGQSYNAAISVPVVAEPRATAEAEFVLAWHFPHQYYPQNDYLPVDNPAVEVGTMYANWFADAVEVTRYVVADLDQLRAKTFVYVDALYETSLPQYFIDAAGANVSILRSPTCFWAQDGTLFGYEGCWFEMDGSCPMNCNHVWGYEHALAWLWPSLERNMRETAFVYHLREDGALHHRVEVPRDRKLKTRGTVADGQCMDVLKVYREHLLSPDGEFLKKYWPLARRAMDFAIPQWDSDRDGVMDLPQHNTHDCNITGPNTFISSQYLAALRAAEEMATLQGDEESARRYRALFDKGRAWIAANLYNGEYYIHKSEEMTYGYGIGCWSEQVVGQWWARLLHLGDILPNDQVKNALRAVYRHNWLWTQEGFEGTFRYLWFADGKDKALLTGSWPYGGRPPHPMLHRDEAWTGIEYMIASHKIYEGQIEEALAIVKGARERYDGRKRSPWNEKEAGDSYVRAMSSWSLLLAAQGYDYNGPEQSLGFDPALTPDDHRSFFSVAQGWGRFEQQRQPGRQLNTLTLMHGCCPLKHLAFGLPAGAENVRAEVRLQGRSVPVHVAWDDDRLILSFSEPVTLQQGDVLTVSATW